MSKKSIHILIPSGITSVRVILAPILFFTLINNFILYSIFIFVLAVATDAVDGYVSRKLDVVSSNGAYFDVLADFILILSGFSGFVINGFYPLWLIIIIVLMFLQFIITSKFRIPVYDPIGKYFPLYSYIHQFNSNKSHFIFFINNINCYIYSYVHYKSFFVYVEE